MFEASYKIGLSAQGANEGAGLILSGEKTATSSLLWKIEKSGASFPEMGSLSVVEDGSANAVCVVQTTWVKVVGFSEIDASFARDYSESDGVRLMAH